MFLSSEHSARTQLSEADEMQVLHSMPYYACSTYLSSDEIVSRRATKRIGETLKVELLWVQRDTPVSSPNAQGVQEMALATRLDLQWSACEAWV